MGSAGIADILNHSRYLHGEEEMNGLIEHPQKFIEQESILLTDTLAALWAGKKQDAFEGALEIQTRWYFPLLAREIREAVEDIIDFVEE